MTARPQSLLGAACVAALFVCSFVVSAQAGPTPEQKCDASKDKAAGKHASCHASVLAKGIGKAIAPDPAGQAKCDTKTTGAFDKAELKAAGACLTTGDAGLISTDLQQCAEDLSTLILNGSDPLVPNLKAKCDSKKVKTAGKYLACVHGARAKATSKGVPVDLAKCTAKLEKLINGANAKGPCSAIGDVAAIQAQADLCFETTLFDGSVFKKSIYTIDCLAAGVIAIELPVEVSVTGMGPVLDGAPFDVELNASVSIDEATADSLVALLNGLTLPTAATIDDATLSTSASAGADAPNPEDLPVVGPIPVDLADDTSVPPNGIPGPHVFSTDPVLTTYNVSVAATQLEIGLDVVEVNLTTSVLPISLTTAGGGDCTLLGSPIVVPVQ